MFCRDEHISCGGDLFESEKDVEDLTLNAPIARKVICFSHLLKCLRSLYCKQCGSRPDCSYWSSLFWVHGVCFYTSFVSNVRHIFAADTFSRRHFQMHIFLGTLRVNGHLLNLVTIQYWDKGILHDCSHEFSATTVWILSFSNTSRYTYHWIQ